MNLETRLNRAVSMENLQMNKLEFEYLGKKYKPVRKFKKYEDFDYVAKNYLLNGDDTPEGWNHSEFFKSYGNEDVDIFSDEDGWLRIPAINYLFYMMDRNRKGCLEKIELEKGKSE